VIEVSGTVMRVAMLPGKKIGSRLCIEIRLARMNPFLVFDAV